MQYYLCACLHSLHLIPVKCREINYFNYSLHLFQFISFKKVHFFCIFDVVLNDNKTNHESWEILTFVMASIEAFGLMLNSIPDSLWSILMCTTREICTLLVFTMQSGKEGLVEVQRRKIKKNCDVTQSTNLYLHCSIFCFKLLLHGRLYSLWISSSARKIYKIIF